MKLDLSKVNWKEDGVTRWFVKEYAEELETPEEMTPDQLANATTYCKDMYNPYAEELMRKAGVLKAFRTTTDTKEKGRIFREAAKSFGILLY